MLNRLMRVPWMGWGRLTGGCGGPSPQTAMEGLRTALSSSTVLEVEVEVTAPTLCLVSTTEAPADGGDPPPPKPQ